MARRGFVLDPPAKEHLLGKVERVGWLSKQHYGFWWLCKRPRAIYEFGPDVLHAVATRVLDWICPDRVLLVPYYITSWRRLVHAEGAANHLFDPFRLALKRHRAAVGPWPRRALEALKEALSLDRDHTLMGGALLEGWSPEGLAELAGAFAWGSVRDEPESKSYDMYLMAPQRTQALRFQHDGSLWCYSAADRDLETFAGICTEVRFDGGPGSG